MKFARLLLGLCLLSPVALAEGLPDLGDYAQTILPPQEERRIGEEIMRDIRASGALVGDVEAADYIAALGQRLAANSSDNRQAFTFFVIQDPTINAFALPGGFIGIHTGLILNAGSESELASVLSHEIGHVVQRHLARMVAQQQHDTIPSIAAMAIAILMARANPELARAGLTAAQAGTVQRQLDYTREHEREADRVGLQILNDSGFDTTAMPAFFETLMKGTRFYDGSAPSFLRTHPLTTERIADVRNRVEQMPYRQVPDSAEFHFVRAKLRASLGAPGNAVQFFESGLQEKKYSNEAAHHYGLAVALVRAHEYEAAQREIDLLRSARQRHPMIEALSAQLLINQNRQQEALNLYRRALDLFPKHRGLIYGYAESLLELNHAEEAIRFLSDKQLAFPNDGYLYELQSQGYTRLGKNMLRHQAQGEAYYRAYDLAGAVEQFELASRSADGDFYQLSIVEARLKQLKQQMGDPKKK